MRILDPQGNECPPARLDDRGRISNYEEAVGEICRVASDAGLFQGYFGDEQATRAKYHDGVYHSGDLGHVVVVDARRFLYFDGRTDDWIRKDGENFSALQVAGEAAAFDGVALAAAYGVPCPVSDEWVMVALLMSDGAAFDPDEFRAFCERQVREGSMDPKWFPDFVRVVDDFEFTNTAKVLVRRLKAAHYHPERVGDEAVFRRRRGDPTFRRFTADDFEALRGEFRAAERDRLL